MSRERGPQGRSIEAGPRCTRTLALLNVLMSVIALCYVLAPPVEGTPRGLDVGVAAWAALIAVLTATLLPRAPRLLDLIFLATWLPVIVMAVTRPSAPGQVAFGTLLVVMSLFAAYFIRGPRFGLHLFGMTAGFLLVRVTDPTGAPTFFAVFTVGVAALTGLVVHSLRQTDDRYQLLVDNTADIIVHTRNGVIQWVSPSSERVLGWSRDELIHHASAELWHPEDGKVARAARDVAADGQPSDGLMRMRHKDGRYVWIEFTVRPVRGGQPGDLVSILRDVSDRVRADEATHRWEHSQREEALRTAEVAESRARLYQNISHELRTPLSIISGPLQEMQHHTDLSPTERADLDAAVRAALRMERLVDGLMSVAQGQSGHLRIRPEPTDVSTLTRSGAQMFAGLAKELGVGLEEQIGPVPPVVLVDPEAWMTILVNLLSNAIKYTQEGTVTVRVEHDGEEAHLQVRDPGIGIPAEALPHVFERFEQAPNRPLHGEAGSGLGLALVAQLVTAAGGRYGIASDVGVGTTVDVWLPAPVCTDVVYADSSHHLDAASRSHAWAWAVQAEPDSDASVPTGPARGRILVAEDNDDLRPYLVRLLRGAGWQVTAVADAESALPLVGEHDLLLSDVMLPGVSGIDIVRRVRQAEGDARWLPIILLTARADDATVLEGLEAGADDYVTKPFSPAELLARIGTHVELSLLRRVVIDEAKDRADNLERALSSNRTIGTALGIIMASERLSPDEAFLRLRQASQHANRKLRDVADDVIYTGAVP